jgi:N12 class adenine-specific DNA methylase/archaellum component FlaC
MASLSNCLKIHFGDKEDDFVSNMVKSQANEIAGKGRVSPDIARKAVHNVIAEFKADSAEIERQIKGLISKEKPEVPKIKEEEKPIPARPEIEMVGRYIIKPANTWKWTKKDGTVRTFSYQHDAEYAQRQAGGEGEISPTGNWSTGQMFEGAWHGQSFKTKEEAVKEAERLDELAKKRESSKPEEPKTKSLEPKSYYFTNEKGKYELHLDRAEFNALPQGVQKDIRAYFLWAPSRKAWVSKGKAGRGYLPELIRKAGLTQRIEEAGPAVRPTIPLTSEVEELKINTGSVLEEQEGGVENVVRPGAPERQVRDDRTSIEGPSSENLPGTEKGGETSGVSEKPRREHDAKLSGSVRGSLDTDIEKPERPVKEGTGIEHESQRDVAPDHGGLAGIQRPDAHDYRITPGALTRVGSWRETASRNLDIIQLVKKLESENRLATPEEQALLVKYVGWGSSDIRNKLFSGYRAQEGELNAENYYGDASWKPIVEKASALLTKEEVQTAARSSQYAHYTSEPVIRSIWNGIKRMGFPGGRIFEPGMGTGNFVGLMPDDIYSKSSYTGIEFDHLTAGVAKQLYQKQNIILGDFTKQTFPNNFFDLSIGNPPFSRTKILADPDYKKYGFAMHNYFFAKSIDKTKPGGLLVFVTSHYTMDARESKIRKYLAERADLVGAVRLPQTAFKESAGTEVVTDILFLRKRAKGEEVGGHPWGNTIEVTVEGGETKLVNEYFGNNPAMVLGTHSGKGTMYGKNEYTVLPKEGNIEDHFTKAIEQLPENIYSITKKTVEEQKEVVTDRDWDPKNKKEGGLYLSDKGELMRVSFGSGVPLSSEEKLTPRDVDWLKAAIPLRDLYKKARHDQFVNEGWEKSLADLNKAYDQFIKKHGNIAEYTVTEKTEVDDEGNKTVTPYYKFKNEKIALLDVEGPLVLSLENVSEDGEITKSVFFSERTIKKPERGEIKSLGDAMAISLDDKGKLDLGHIAELLGRPKETMAEEMGDLVYENPSGTWEISDEYLSGDVVSKLEQAEAAAKTDRKYQRNVEALAAVQPKPLTPNNITVKLGAPWIDPKYIEDFTWDVLKLNSSITYHPEANRWGIIAKAKTGRNGAPTILGKHSQRGVSDWGTPDRGANEILESVLNRTKIIIKRTEQLPGGSTRTFTDEVATTAANEKAREMDERFSQWIWEEADRADYFLNTYNRRYNNLAKRIFNGDHLTLPGTSLRYALHAHQKTAIWRVIQTGNTYLAHAIGSGKTIESIAAGMEMKRLGLIQKPMYVVPNHMLKQFASEFMDLYPMANIMVADDENFHTTNRRRFMAQASVNKPDAIIITHSSYGLLSMKPENVQVTKDIILNDLRQALEDLRAEGGARHLIRNIEQRIEQAEQRFDSISSSKKGDHVVDFEDMGVDFLFVDEAHMFRKLDFATNQQVKGIDPNGSRMALDLYLKTQYLESKTPGRSHVFMSGTPITNTMGELFTIMKFFDEAAMEKDGIRHFDAWSSMFGETRPDYEPNAAGRYELVTRFAKFNNLPELRKRVGMFMDVLTTRQLKEYVKGIPKVEGGEPKYVLALPSDELKKYQEGLQVRLEQSRKWKPSPGQKGNPDPVINIITDGRLAGIDMRFVNPRLKNDPGSKLNLMIEEIIKDYKSLKNNTYLDKDGKQEPIKGGAQIVFYNHGFGAAVTHRRGFDAKGWVNGQLKKGGIPSNEIAWIDDYDTAVKKEALYKEMRQGQKKILIGSAKRMGTGLNVQKRLAALQYLDAPWYPADVSQPHGRIVRQGNQNKEVTLKWYATKGTYDSTMWQMVSRKEGFIEQFFDGDDNLRSMEDISEINQYEMARALSSGDERIIKLVGLQSEQAKLSRLKEAHAQEQNQLRSEKSRLEWSINNYSGRIKELETAYEKVGGYVSSFEAQIGNQKGITKRGDLGEAVIAAYNKASDSLTKEVEEKEYGKINGFPLVAIKKFATALNVVQITPKVQYTIDEGLTYSENTDTVGLGRRILNQINKVSDELDNTKSELKDQKEKLDHVSKRIGTPFSKDRDLSEKIAEIAQLQNELIKEGEEVDEGKIAEAKQKVAEEAAKKEKEKTEAEKGVYYSYGVPEGKEEAVFTPRPGAKKVDLLEGFEFFVYKNDEANIERRWTVVEATTGLSAGSSGTRESAIDAARTTLNKEGTRALLTKKINEAIESGEVSPWYKANNPEAQFSKSEPTQAPISRPALDAIVSRITAPWKNAPKIEVVEAYADLPEAIRAEAEAKKAGLETIEGAHFKGTVYLVRSNIESGVRLKEILFHEALGHYGLRGILGDQFRPIMNRVFNAYGPEKMALIAKDYGLDLSKDRDKQTAAEEMISRMAETGEKPGILKEIYAAVRAALRRMGFDLKITDADIHRLLTQSREFVEKGFTSRDQGGKVVSMAIKEGIKEKIKLFRSYGAEINGDKIVLYRGGDVSKKELSNLRYGDYLSASESGKDITGNESATGYGKNVVRFELPIKDIEVTGAGEFQYKGKSTSLEGGNKYPPEIYRAYNDLYGSNFTAAEIDKESDVRQSASQALPGGREEFDSLMAKHIPPKKTSPSSAAEGQAENIGITVEKKFPIAKENVDGRIVRKDVSNTDSISSSLDNYTVLPGIREVPMSEFELTGKSYSVSENKRIAELAEKIKESGEISPLIVVVDKEGSYILEGSHRADALYQIGAKSFPALVVIDRRSFAEGGERSPQYSLKSRTDLDQDKVDEELANYDKFSFPDQMATIKDMVRNWGKAERVGRPDTSMLGRFLGSPEFTFEKVPALKKVITHNLERADLRVEKFNDLISDTAGRDLHVGMRNLQKERPEEYKKLGEFIIRADQNKRVYNAEKVKAMGFSDQAVDAWKDFRVVMDNGFDRQIAQYQEMVRRNQEAGLPPPEIVILDEKGQPKAVSVKTAIALMGEMRGWYAPRLREAGQWQIVATATKEMKEKGLHNKLEFKDFMVEHRVAELRRQGYRVEYFKSKSIPEDLFAIYGKTMGTEQMVNEALNRSMQEVGKKSNFQFSDMGIKTMWATSADEKPDFILDTKKVPQEQLSKVMPIIKAMGGKWYAAQKDEPKFWHFVDADKRFEGRLRRALSRYDNRLLLVEEEFARALTVNIANIEKGRGFRSSMIQRGPEVGVDVWEGYEMDPLRAMTSYASRLAAGEAKKETALKMIRAFNGTEKSWAKYRAENEDAEYEDYIKFVEKQRVSPTEQKNAYHDGLTYIQEALRNPEMADRVVGWAKGLANFKYLGFRVAAPIVNLTALVTSVPAAMNGYAGIPIHSTFKWLGKGADLFRQYRHPETWATLPSEIQEAFKTIQTKGWAESQYNREAMEVLKSRVGRGWNQAMDASMWMFGLTEQLNRVSTLMGTFAAIREREGGSAKKDKLSEKEMAAVEKAMGTAKRVSDRAHGVYGPGTLPAIAQGKGPAGMVIKSLYMFKKFQHTYLQTLYELGWKQGNWKAASYMMVAPTLLAGAGALPLPGVWDALMGIFKHLFGADDPEEKFFSFMENTLGDYIGGIPRQGISGLGGHGFDLRGSLGMGKVDVPTNIVELLGAPGSVFSDLYQGGANILKGNVWKGAEKVLPRAAGTVMQAAREATEGVTTKTGAPVFFGREQMKADFGDAVLRSLSFNPASIQKMKDIRWSEKQTELDYRDRRGDINSRFLKYFLLPAQERDKTKMVDLVDSVHQYNARVLSHGLAGVEPRITSDSIRAYMSRNMKPSKKELIKGQKREG